MCSCAGAFLLAGCGLTEVQMSSLPSPLFLPLATVKTVFFHSPNPKVITGKGRLEKAFPSLGEGLSEDGGVPPDPGVVT